MTTQRIGRELKIALAVAVPFGIMAAVALSWQQLFPVPSERLVEVVWTHECSCARGWMTSLRDAGFVVRDFEQDELSRWQQQWHIPNHLRGCHPARFMGYFLEGHVTPQQLWKLAREKPTAIGVRSNSSPQVPPSAKLQTRARARIVLITADGTEVVWDSREGQGDEKPSVDLGVHR